MIRKFALVVLDNRDMVIDRINLDLVSEPKGLGFSLKTSTITTDIEEILVRYKQQLENITFDVNYAFGNEYIKAKSIRQWIEKNTGRKMAIEYLTPADKLYANCIVDKFAFSEINNDKVLSIPLNIKQLSPFFDVVYNAILIYPSTTGKVYSYTYPYTYGIGVASNNIIENNYIKPIPLNITLYGEMMNPGVNIRKQGEVLNYGEVSFSGLNLTSDMWVNINAITGKITLFNGYTESDGYNYIDATKNSFIYANIGISELGATISSDKSGRLEASFRRYRL